MLLLREILKSYPFFQPKHIQFEFPDVTKDIEEDKTKLEKATKQMDQVKAQFKRNYGVVGGRRRGAPTFFGL